MSNQAEMRNVGSARTIWSLVLDSSGSMSGRKMRAMKEAVKQILAHLPNQDSFEIQVLQRVQRDPGALNLAAEAIESLQGRSQTPRFYRLTGD